MKAVRCVAPVFLLIASIYAQNSNSQEGPVSSTPQKLSFIADQVLQELPNLRLGGNRAVIDAKAGSFLCKTDPPRATKLFRSAIAELVDAQMLAQNERKTYPPNELLTSRITRPAVLTTIARCDAALALASLYETRPPAIERAISGGGEKPSKITDIVGNDPALAQNELSLQRSLTELAADQDPSRASALYKESLRRGLSTDLLALLKKVAKNDPDEAGRLSKELIDKINEKGFISSGKPISQSIMLAAGLLTECLREKKPDEKAVHFDDSQIKGLADSLFAAYIAQSTSGGSFPSVSLLPIAEKLSPAFAARMKGLQKPSDPPRATTSQGVDPGPSALLSSNPTAEKLISEAPNYPLEQRRGIYTTAANKLADAGDFGAATALLNENFADDALANALESVSWYYAHLLINRGKFTEAEHVINDFPDTNRQSALIDLALSVFAKDKIANKTLAEGILDRVRTQMPENPSKQSEMSQVMQVVSAYTKIDSTGGFQILESLSSRLNELCDASITMSIYQGAFNMRQGEFLLGQGLPAGPFIDIPLLNVLAEKDFDRTNKLIDSFTRPEMRISVKLQIAEYLANRTDTPVRK